MIWQALERSIKSQRHRLYTYIHIYIHIYILDSKCIHISSSIIQTVIKFIQSCSKTSHVSGCINLHICTFATVIIYIYMVTIALHFIFLFFSSHTSDLLSLSFSSLFLYHFLSLLFALFRLYKLTTTSEDHVGNSESSSIGPISGGCFGF